MDGLERYLRILSARIHLDLVFLMRGNQERRESKVRSRNLTARTEGIGQLLSVKGGI